MEVFTPKSIKFEISEAKKAQGKHCCAYHCKNVPHPKKRGLCHTHYSRWRRLIDPVYDRFVNFKGNALRRNKNFTITLEEFREFCNRTGYIIKKGKRGRNCTVDRIRNWEGYHIDNIQLITDTANVRKYHDHDKHFTELPEDDPDYLPF